MRTIRVLFFRPSESVKSSPSTRVSNSVLAALQKLANVDDVWVVPEGGSFAREYDKRTRIYNYKAFSDGKQLVESLRPDLIISYGDYEYVVRSVALAGMACGIPVVMIVGSVHPSFVYQRTNIRKTIKGRLWALKDHGMTISDRYCFLLKTLARSSYGISYILKTIARDLSLPFSTYEPSHRLAIGNLVLVSGSDWVEPLVKRGYERKRIAVVGDITLDESFANISSTHRTREDNRIRILLLTSTIVEHGIWTPSMRDEAVTKVVIAIKEKLGDGANLTIKIHPHSENREHYQKLVEPIEPRVSILQYENLLAVCDNSDVVVTLYDTWALMEALILNKPTYIINTFNENYKNIEYIKEGVVLECKNADEFVDNISKSNFAIADPQKVKKFIENKIYKFDGECGKRAAGQIISLLDSISAHKNR